MARGRIITPDFWTDGKIIGLTPFARLFYIGLWNFALCDEGHLPDDALGLKLKVLPADPVDASDLLDELLTAGRLVRLEAADAEGYLHIPTFSSYQKADTRWNSRCPVCRRRASQNPTEPQPSLGELPQTQRREEKRGEEKRGSSTAPRGARIPSDFAITDAMREWARETTPLVNIDAKLPEFIDYWSGVPGAKGVKLDWVAAWRNGMRKQQEFAERDRSTRKGKADPDAWMNR